MNQLSIRPSPSSEFALRFPSFVLFSEAYLHQDWDIAFDSPEEALVAFGRNHPDARASLSDAANALLREQSTEADRYEVLASIGWNFWGPAGRLDALLTWARETMAQRSVHNSTG